MTNTEYVKVVDKIIEMLDTQRENTEKEMEECKKYESYSLDEQRYDEGYTNALLWASLTIAKEMYKGIFHD